MPTILILVIIAVLIIIAVIYWLTTKASGKSGGEVHSRSHDSDANH
jgi:hypothetical protein